MMFTFWHWSDFWLLNSPISQSSSIISFLIPNVGLCFDSFGFLFVPKSTLVRREEGIFLYCFTIQVLICLLDHHLVNNFLYLSVHLLVQVQVPTLVHVSDTTHWLIAVQRVLHFYLWEESSIFYNFLVPPLVHVLVQVLKPTFFSS